MKRLIFTAAILLTFGATGFCGDPYTHFAQNITADGMKPFAKDLGAILGSGLYTSGRSLGFSGFDLGVRGAAVFSPSRGNVVVEKSGTDTAWMPWVQGEIGMPFRLDGFVRAYSNNGLTMAGGGLRWGITELNTKPYAFQSMIVVAGHAASHQSFSAVHVSANLVSSLNGVWYVPYIGVGVDRTKLTVTEADAQEIDGSVVSTTQPRGVLGITFRPWQFMYFGVAGNFLSGQTAFSSDMGVRF